jgi:asparagine synthase (glutamine-hydrolysing)
MGGIAGLVTFDGAVEAAERAALGDGPHFDGDGAYFVAPPRSTLARSGRFVVMVAGHFDRSPATGLGAADALLEAWEARGEDALASFEGAWVATVWDRRAQVLHLLRDPFGIRRLYWSRKALPSGGVRLAFSTQPRRLLDLPWVSRELARENLAEHLSFRYVHAPRTLLRDVSALPAGHRLRHDRSGSRLAPWFQLRYSPPYASHPEDRPSLDELERRLNRAVAARASGRERVGVFLSGGLDSTAIAHYASRLGPIHTFTVGVLEGEGDETPYAGRVANLLRTRHEVLRVDFPAFADAFPTAVSQCDAPVTDPAAIPQLLLARQARTLVDVVLSGDGGDEIFGGRMAGRLAREARISHLLQRLPGPAGRGLGALLGERRPELSAPGVPFGLARRIGGVHVFDAAARERLLRDPGWVRPGIRQLCLEPFYREVVSDPVNEVLHAYLRGRMAEDSLLRSGLAATAAGIGLREPLLDRDLVAWCAAQPGPWKVRSGPGGVVTKWPLRELLRPVLPRGLLNRPKRVLPGPWGRWFAGPARQWLAERVASVREDPLRLFMPSALDTVLRSDPPVEGRDAEVWSLVFLDAWLRDVRAT